jgi:hypothetical protein
MVRIKINWKEKSKDLGRIIVESTSWVILTYSVRNMELFMRERLPIRPNQTSSWEKELVNAMLDTTGLSKAWWGETLLTLCHVLNRVPTKNKEKTPYEEWEGRKPSLSYLHT